MFIYVIVNSENLKLYVGQHKGESLERYLGQKWSEAQRLLSRGSHLYNAMRKYSRESWSIHPLISGIDERKELDERERHYIRVLKTQHPEVGYNFCDGGEGRMGPHSDETKKKIKEHNAKYWTGKQLSEDHARKLREGREKYHAEFGAWNKGLKTGPQESDVVQRRANYTKNWWASLTPDQRKEQSQKIVRGQPKGPRKTHCRRGHPRTPENLSASRACKKCRTINKAEWRQRQKTLKVKRFASP